LSSFVFCPNYHRLRRETRLDVRRADLCVVRRDVLLAVRRATRRLLGMT
jgi:hypothetical protein